MSHVNGVAEQVLRIVYTIPDRLEDEVRGLPPEEVAAAFFTLEGAGLLRVTASGGGVRMPGAPCCLGWGLTNAGVAVAQTLTVSPPRPLAEVINRQGQALWLAVDTLRANLCTFPPVVDDPDRVDEALQQLSAAEQLLRTAGARLEDLRVAVRLYGRGVREGFNPSEE